MSIFIGRNYFIPQEHLNSSQDLSISFLDKLIQEITDIVKAIFKIFTSDQKSQKPQIKASRVVSFEKYEPKATPSSTIEEATEKLRVECQELKDDCRKIKAEIAKTDPEFKLENYSNPAIKRFIQTNDFLPDSVIKLGTMTLEPAQAKGFMLGLKRDYERNNPTTVDSIRKSQQTYSRTLPRDTLPCASGAS